MSDRIKTLIIVEGKRLEPAFFKQMEKAFGLNLDFCCFNNNIYVLYRKLKQLDFNANIKDVLLEANYSEANREMLSQQFAFTYLIFDFDPHHTEEFEKNLPIDRIVSNNIERVKEMAAYFVDETDPTIGKLYINYPMMESFKDCDSFDDEGYLSRTIELSRLKNYKKIVGTRKMANKRLDRYSKDDFARLTRQNIKKVWTLFQYCLNQIGYEEYLTISEQTHILNQEAVCIQTLKQIAVLNTSVFLALDYYGNKGGFFDSIINY
ncbi:MAG: hypothetical protein J5854_02295 [Clostridia bacterium]|nr:hypothetical protein [Clostridia bacterium]